MTNPKLTRTVAVVFIVILLLSCFMIPCLAADISIVADDSSVNVNDFIDDNSFDIAIYVPDVTDTYVHYNPLYKGMPYDFLVGSSNYPSYYGRYISFSLIDRDDDRGALNYSTCLYPQLMLRDGVYYAYLDINIQTKFSIVEFYNDDYSITLNDGDFIDFSLHTELISDCSLGFDNRRTSYNYLDVTIAYPLSYVPDFIGASITFDRVLDFGTDNNFNVSLSPFHDYGGTTYNGSRLNMNTKVFQFIHGALGYIDVYDTLNNQYFPDFADVFSIEFLPDNYTPTLDTIIWLLDNTTVSLLPDQPPQTDYDRGFDDGWLVGYEQAKLDWEEIYHEEGYREGYAAGKNYVVSETFAKNTLISFITAPVLALDSLVLFDYGVTTLSLWDLVMVAIGFSLFIWFLKLFAGG